MDRKSFLCKSIYWVAAFLACVLLLTAAAGNPRRPAKTSEYRIVVLGDSIMGLCRDETSIPAKLSERLQRPVFNGALGGTCLTLRLSETTRNYSMELMNMVSLSKSIAADDFGVQLTVRNRQAATDYFEDTIRELSTIDFGSVDLLLLEYGANDYHAAVPLNNAQNALDEETFQGALRSVIGTIRKAYPELNLVLVTPTYTWYCSNGLTCEEFDTGNGFLERYVNAILEVAQEMNVECVDLYHEVYRHETWEDWRVYTEDGLHPNEDSREVIADILAEKIMAWGY